MDDKTDVKQLANDLEEAMNSLRKALELLSKEMMDPITKLSKDIKKVHKILKDNNLLEDDCDSTMLIPKDSFKKVLEEDEFSGFDKICMDSEKDSLGKCTDDSNVFDRSELDSYEKKAENKEKKDRRFLYVGGFALAIFLIMMFGMFILNCFN